MGPVEVEISVSVDGFITGPNEQGAGLGDRGSGAVVDPTYVYANNITYRDITSGNNGAPCLVGLDLCSGRGSWTGTTP